MPFFSVPLTSDPNYKFTIVLSGSLFLIKIQFNRTIKLFTLSLFDENEDPIFSGRAIVLGSKNLLRGSDPRIPPEGLMVSFDLTETHTEVDRDNIGVSTEVFYAGPI